MIILLAGLVLQLFLSSVHPQTQPPCPFCLLILLFLWCVAPLSHLEAPSRACLLGSSLKATRSLPSSETGHRGRFFFRERAKRFFHWQVGSEETSSQFSRITLSRPHLEVQDLDFGTKDFMNFGLRTGVLSFWMEGPGTCLCCYLKIRLQGWVSLSLILGILCLSVSIFFFLFLPFFFFSRHSFSV